MNSNKELKVAYWLIGILLFVAFLCYAMPKKEEPEIPVRKMFQCKAGKVLFTHQAHFSDSAYAVSCQDCHHHYEDEENIRACGDCHEPELTNTVPGICKECHEPDENHHPEGEEAEYTCNECHSVADGESLPESCADCHEDEIESIDTPMTMQKRMDAFHNQCTQCHKEYGIGPMYVDEDCASCHVSN